MLFVFLYLEYPGEIKPEAYLPLPPFTGGFSDKGPFIHPGCVAEMQLENVSARFNIKAHRQRMIIPAVGHANEYM